MIKSEKHILVILQMFTKSNLNICVKCKIFLDDGIENIVSDWCQEKSVNSMKIQIVYVCILIDFEFLFKDTGEGFTESK